MAGIGLELRKLLARDDLIGIAEGYGYAALATSGPWLFTILALTATILLGTPFTSPHDLAIFRMIIVYNFSFSLVLTGPTAIVMTRYLADALYAKDVHEAPASLLGGLSLAYAISAPAAAYLYLVRAQLDGATRAAALLNFLLISGIWIVTVFLTALKDYRGLAVSFGSGMFLGVVGAAVLAIPWAVTGMLQGFNAGLAVILFSLTARIFGEYPTRPGRPFVFLRYFRTHWDLALAALAYNTAIWADKWLMWLSPEREVLGVGLVSCPSYESAMFLAYLSVVPSMAAFTLSIETGFFEKYTRFYDDIQRHVPFKMIESNHRDLIRSFLEGARNFVVLQGSVCAAGILVAPQLLEWTGVNFEQLGMFRLGLLGAFFHSGFLFLMIFLAYFDLRRMTLYVASLFLGANTLFTLATLKLGFPFYGYGYFLSALVAFAAAFTVTDYFIRRLPYQAFVRSNSSVTL
jgi:polysaccharide biosynthesis protein PelG